MSLVANLEKMLAAGQDSPVLRLSLGNAFLQAQEPARAVEHLAKALEQQPDYSAAWKLYGKALAEAGRPEEAMAAYRNGIAVAERRGDLQAAKEMRVFLKRLEKGAGNAGRD